MPYVFEKLWVLITLKYAVDFEKLWVFSTLKYTVYFEKIVGTQYVEICCRFWNRLIINLTLLILLAALYLGL
jgi:hypothetical protein